MDSLGFKDNRSKEKRGKMKQHRKGPPPQPMPQRGKRASEDSSSSYHMETRRGIIDVADSSDERCYPLHPTTRFVTQAPQHDLDELDLREKQLEEHPQLNAGDFKIMSQMPTSVGGHFQFSSEKNWDTEESLLLNTEAREYFTLNLKLLNVGLQTIPFYKRMDFASSMFSRDQLVAMDQAADEAEKQYQQVLQEHISNPKITIKSSRKTASAKSQRSAKMETKLEKDDELDELLNMTESHSLAKLSLENGENKSARTLVAPVEGEGKGSAASNNGAPGSTVSGAKEDIQHWLDSVLDE